MTNDEPKEPVINGEKPENTVERNPDGTIKSGSLNPAGRPKGAKNLTTLLVEALKGTTKNGKTWEQNLIEQVINQAVVKGDMRAIEHIWDRTEGKPEQGHVVTGNLTIAFDKAFEGKDE